MEPVTIFSTTLAVLNILISTIATSTERIDQFWTFKDTILQHYHSLCICKLKLELWTLRWRNTDAIERRSRELFGDQTWNEIMDMHQKVHASVEKLESWIKLEDKDATPEPRKLRKQRHLKHSSESIRTAPSEAEAGDLSMADQQQWNSVISAIEARRQPELKDGLTRRILGVFGRNKILEERVKSATSNVDRLVDYTKLRYERLSYNRDSSMSGEDLASDHDKIAFVALATQLSYCHIAEQCDLTERWKWFLQLRLPDESQDCAEFWRQTRLRRDLRFTTSKHILGGVSSSREVRTWKARREADPQFDQGIVTKFSDLRLSQLYNNEGDLKLLISETLYTLEADTGPRMTTKAWNALLDLCCGADENVKFVLLLQRARLAYSLVVWVVLLWGTPFMSTICCCCLRCVEFGRQIEHGKFRSEFQSVFAPCQAHMGPAAKQDHPDQAQKEKLFALGTVLAELMLGRTIGPNFKVQDVVRAVEIELFMMAPSTAVWYCLNTDWEVLGSIPRPQQIQDLVRNVVSPVKQYFDKIQTWVKEKPRRQAYGTRLAHENRFRDLSYCSPVPQLA